MTKAERMKEIMKANPDFGKGVGYKMCVVDELNDMKEQTCSNCKHYAKTYAKTYELCYYSLGDEDSTVTDKHEKWELKEELENGKN